MLNVKSKNLTKCDMANLTAYKIVSLILVTTGKKSLQGAEGRDAILFQFFIVVKSQRLSQAYFAEISNFTSNALKLHYIKRFIIVYKIVNCQKVC